MTKYTYFLYYNLIGENMKVKVFDEENESDLESKINSFIDNVDEIYDIKYNVAVGISGEDQIYCFSALIMYE